MAFDMIDAAIAEHVRSQLVIGEFANFITGPESKTFNFKILDIKDFSVIVETKLAEGYFQKLELSIAKSELYKEADKMSERMPLPTIEHETAKPKPRGKPSKQAATAPNNQSETVASWQTATQPHPLLEGVRQMLETANVDFEDNWIEKALDEACNNFKADLLQIVKAVYVQPEPAANIVPVQKTCFDCVMINVKENKCDKFQIIPPMFVMADSKGQCPDFIDKNDIPF